MPRGNRVQKKLKKKFIRRFGVDVIQKRYTAGSENLNIFGEPDDGTWALTETSIRIVVDTDKREVDETLIGGLPQYSNKEVLYFYCAGDADIQIGDKIVYPPSTPNEWIVYFFIPNMFDGVDVINEVKCHRDSRT